MPIISHTWLKWFKTFAFSTSASELTHLLTTVFNRPNSLVTFVFTYCDFSCPAIISILHAILMYLELKFKCAIAYCAYISAASLYPRSISFLALTFSLSASFIYFYASLCNYFDWNLRLNMKSSSPCPLFMRQMEKERYKKLSKCLWRTLVLNY